MEREGMLESVGSTKGPVGVQGELPDWYIGYLVYLYERELHFAEMMDDYVPAGI